MKVKLTVQDHLVGYFQIPPFQTPPDVLVWGDRIFKIRNVEPPPMDNCSNIYDEAFAYYIATGPI